MKLVIDTMKEWGTVIGVCLCLIAFGGSIALSSGCSFLSSPASTPINTGTSVDSLTQIQKDAIPASGRSALASIQEAENAREVAAVAATAGVPGTDRIVLALDRYTDSMRAHTEAIVRAGQTESSAAWKGATQESLTQAGWLAIAGYLAGNRKRKAE
jgi:hypothetical protein